MSDTVDSSNPTIGTLNPSVKLPPAALRLPTLDFDPTGNPYYKFPPFLTPPDGVQLIPFDRFKARGIEICLDSDVEELDGEGIPTIQLGTKHAAPDDRERKKKKKRSKKEGDGPAKVSPWYDDWAEGEDLRRASSFDPNTPRTDRFAQGAADFQLNRKWHPAIQSLYDYFRHYCGLLGHPNKHLRFGRDGGGDVGNDEADGDDEAELTAEQKGESKAEDIDPLPEPVVVAEEDSRIREIDTEYRAEEEAKEMKMDAFLNDPEEGMKIFFSSYYKDKGLFWSVPKLRDGPILLSFFLGFFIRNRLMPDYEKALRKAYKVAELARLELPQTTKISMAIPDTFGTACAELWGSRMPKAWVGKNAIDVDGKGGWLDPKPDPLKQWEAELREKGMEEISVDVDATAPTESSGWGGGWGDGAAPLQNGADSWFEPGGTEDWGANKKTVSLLSVLGPTTLPLTHGTQLAEKSTRQIVSLAPPNTDLDGLGSVLGTVVLAPWKNPTENSTIVPPELLTDLPEGSTFDLARDTISAYVNPQTVEVLRVGMGLHAVFVQVVQTQANTVEVKKKKSRSKGKGKGSDDREWWYMEFLYEVIPSFWTEEGE